MPGKECAAQAQASSEHPGPSQMGTEFQIFIIRLTSTSTVSTQHYKVCDKNSLGRPPSVSPWFVAFLQSRSLSARPYRKGKLAFCGRSWKLEVVAEPLSANSSPLQNAAFCQQPTL